MKAPQGTAITAHTAHTTHPAHTAHTQRTQGTKRTRRTKTHTTRTTHIAHRAFTAYNTIEIQLTIIIRLPFLAIQSFTALYKFNTIKYASITIVSI